MAGPSLMDSLFQRSLDDLIKGLRLYHPDSSTATFISKSVDEIRREIKTTDPSTKSVALQKLTYLHSLYAIDMSWAAFHCIELSSSPVFNSKRIAYLGASLSFNPSTTDVILLLTHQLRKDLSSVNPHEVSVALQTLSAICTPDLARDLTPELFTLLGSSRISIKKKAIAAVLRVFELYPDAVRVCFKRLVENLENSDIGVVSAVVGVFCELATKEPKSYLPLAPEFYRILVDSRNNWLLIKILKIFAKLAPLEPRLGKRIVETVCEHLKRTDAKSLAFECVRTILIGLSDYDSAVKLAVEKIREFLLEDDPNLKYLGLEALAVVAPKHLWAVLESKEIVIKSLSDDDENIKLAALKLVLGMVSEDNLAEICRVLMNYALKSGPYFCNEILDSIITTCSKNYYEIIIDFDWYVSLLGEMARIPHCQKGDEIENQLVDIGMRVKDVRPALVRVARSLLIDPALLGNPSIHRILAAAAWVSGEYVEFSKNLVELMEALLQPRTSLLPPSIRAIYVHGAFKVLIFSMHSYFMRKEAVASSNLRLKDSIANKECAESSGLATVAVVESGPEDGLYSKSVDQPIEDTTLDEKDMINGFEWSSASQEQITQEFLIKLIDFAETHLITLLASHEIELQERAKNVLGFIGITRHEISGGVLHEEGDSEMAEVRGSEVVELVNETFFEEIGPVSVRAQERVSLPDGLYLKENLNDLDALCSDFKIPSRVSFLVGKTHSLENDASTVHDHQKEEGDIAISESTSLLAEHRKRHELYYLPSKEKEKVSNDYPPANDLSNRDNSSNDTEDLFKLTDQSLIAKKKLGNAKPRPVVVRLDEGDRVHLSTENLEPKVDLISGAVRDILLGNEAVASSSRSNKHEKSSNKVSVKEKSSFSEVPIGSAHADSTEFGSTSARRNKHHAHGKEKKNRSSRKGTSEQEQKDKLISSSHHSRRKSRQRADASINLQAQSPVVPDFLL